MGTNKIKIDSTAKQFVRRIKKSMHPIHIILFGSRASGDAWEYSDYDFIIVSNSFEKIHWLKRISSLLMYWDSDKPIDILPYTAKEFVLKKQTSSVVREAIQKGVFL